MSEAHERFRAADGEFRLVHFARTFHGLIDDGGNEISASPGDRKWISVDDAKKVHARRGGVIIGSKSRDAILARLGR